MHVVTAIVNDQPITCVVTDRGVAPVAQLDPTLPRVWRSRLSRTDRGNADVPRAVRTAALILMEERHERPGC